MINSTRAMAESWRECATELHRSNKRLAGSNDRLRWALFASMCCTVAALAWGISR